MTVGDVSSIGGHLVSGFLSLCDVSSCRCSGPRPADSSGIAKGWQSDSVVSFQYVSWNTSGKSAALHMQSGVSFIEEKEDQCLILALFLQVFRIMNFLSLHHHPEHNH